MDADERERRLCAFLGFCQENGLTPAYPIIGHDGEEVTEDGDAGFVPIPPDVARIILEDAAREEKAAQE